MVGNLLPQERIISSQKSFNLIFLHLVYLQDLVLIGMGWYSWVNDMVTDFLFILSSFFFFTDIKLVISTKVSLIGGIFGYHQPFSYF